jgi:alanine racemase
VSAGDDRWAWADVDLDAVAHNVRVIRAEVAPAQVWAVVKADGYGHGAVPVARAAVAAGADGILVEVHPTPDRAKCDASQTITPADLATIHCCGRALHAALADAEGEPADLVELRAALALSA